MLLFPEIFQQYDDPFFIVTRKTLGSAGSLFSKISALSYSPDPVAGRLLKATIVNPEQVILNPGERIEKIIEIEEGLITPRQLKIQFTTLGDTVFEEEIQVRQKAFSGTAIDIDPENNYVDIYAVIVPEELTKELEEYYASTPSGAPVFIAKKVSIKEAKQVQTIEGDAGAGQLQPREESGTEAETQAELSGAEQLQPGEESAGEQPGAGAEPQIKEQLPPEESQEQSQPEAETPKKNLVGFAQQILEQFAPAQYAAGQYQLELGLYEPGSSEAFFSDLYGPYELRQNQTFIFAQQLKYDPKIYAGDYDLTTRIYRGGKLLVENKFDLELGQRQRSLLWFWVLGQIVLLAGGAFAYLYIKKQKYRLKKALE